MYEVDTRTVFWVYDRKGCVGKSKFTVFAEVLLNAQLLTQSTSKVLACSIVKLSNYMGCYIFDLPRGKGSDGQDDDVLKVTEALKNGYIFSFKVKNN